MIEPLQIAHIVIAALLFNERIQVKVIRGWSHGRSRILHTNTELHRHLEAHLFTELLEI